MILKNNRRFRNFFIAPNKQLRLAFFAVSVGVITLLVFFAFQIFIFSNLIRNLAPMLPETMNVEPMLADSIHWSWIGFFLGALFFAILMSSVMVLISHRIYGPMVAIRKHLTSILQGEYEHRTHLRKHDEFKEVAEDLNRLSQILREKNPPPTP